MVNKKAAIYIPDMSAGGGAERYAVDLSVVLAGIGYEVSIFSRDCDIQKVFEYYSSNIGGILFNPLINLNLKGPRELKRLLNDISITRKIRDYKPELFFNLGYKSEIPGCGEINYYICHFPHRIDVKYNSFMRQKFMNFFSFLRSKILYSGKKSFILSYNSILSNSEFTASHVVKRWGFVSEVLEPPCRMYEFSLSRVRESRSIISVGRFEDYKGNVPHKRQDLLIKAFIESETMLKEGWTLHCVGSLREDGREYYKSLVELSEGYPVIFHPNASAKRLSELYASCEVYWHAQGSGTDAELYPEAQEHFGMSVVEALSAGLSPVVYDGAGPAEIVKNLQTGATWEYPDEIIPKTLEVYKKLSKNYIPSLMENRNRAEKYSIDNFSDRLFKILKNDSL